MRELAERLTQARAFEYAIGLIVGNGVLLGLETSPRLVDNAGEWLDLGQRVVLWVFVAEAALDIRRLAACRPLLPRRLEPLRLLHRRPLLRPRRRRLRHHRSPRPPGADPPPRLRPPRAPAHRHHDGALHPRHAQHRRPDKHRRLRLRHHRLPALPRPRPRALAQPRHLPALTLPRHHPGGLDRIMYTAMELHPWAWLYFVSFGSWPHSWSSTSSSPWSSTTSTPSEERLRALQEPKSADALINELRATQQWRLEDELHQRRNPDGTLADPP